MTLEQLYQIILERKRTNSDNSYVASLFNKGTDRIIQKVGEEAVEVVIAAKNKRKQQTISEIADLLFHLTILLVHEGLTYNDILLELEKRKK